MKKNPVHQPHYQLPPEPVDLDQKAAALAKKNKKPVGTSRDERENRDIRQMKNTPNVQTFPHNQTAQP